MGGTDGRPQGSGDISESSGLQSVPLNSCQDHRRKNKAPACALPGRSVSENTVKWDLGPLDPGYIPVLGCFNTQWEGSLFGRPTKATRASLGVPRLINRASFIHGRHSVPSSFVPPVPESLAAGRHVQRNSGPNP